MSALNPETLSASQAALWSEWEQRYERAGVPVADICRDGVGNPDRYCDAPVRVLTVLREPNKSRGNGMLDVLKGDPVQSIWHNVARWVAGAQTSFPEFQRVDDILLMRSALGSSSAINLKKRSGEADANWPAINSFASRDRDLLARQIDLLSPTLIITGGTLDQLIWVLDLDIRLGQHPRYQHSSGRSVPILPWYHPASRRSADKLYSGLAELAHSRLAPVEYAA